MPGFVPDGGDEGLAPVIPLFAQPVALRGTAAPRAAVESTGSTEGAALEGSRSRAHADVDRAQWHTTWTDEAVDDAPPVTADEAERAATAEHALLKRLRTRSLSEREARAALREHDLSDGAVEMLVAGMRGHGYLDDARLAEQLVHSGTTRKGLGRQALGRTLAQRGIPRDIADGALAELADDDAERALEYARGKAQSMRHLDRDTALRRLSGQLARRGYGATALSAARQSLDELAAPRGSVRFE